MFTDFKMKTRLIAGQKAHLLFDQYVKCHQDGGCVFHYVGVSRLLKMRLGNALLADTILRQGFQTELPESSPKETAPRIGTELGPLKNNFVACFWCLAFYYRHSLMPLNGLQKHDRLPLIPSRGSLCSLTV